MKNHSLMEEIQKGQVVLVKNKGDAEWLSGCIYLGEIQDGCSKTHSVEDWNGFQRRFHFMKPVKEVCINCKRYPADTGIICNECGEMIKICNHCKNNEPLHGIPNFIICPNCKSTLSVPYDE